MKIRRSLLKDTVTVETYGGEGAYGPVYATPVSVPCNIDTTRRLVRSVNGDEAVSEATLYAHPDDAPVFTPESRLTIAGRTSTVLAVNPQTLRGSVALVKVACS